MCVFTYGQTNSGKTYTMKGEEKDPGLVLRTLEGLFGQLGIDMKCCFEVSLSYFEIYNEAIYDLLSDQPLEPLDIRENKDRSPFVQGLAEVHVADLESARRLFQKGEARRKYGITTLNINSSRSHVVVQLKVKTRFVAAPTKTYEATLLMADLAGSECIAKAETKGSSAREGSLINKSLLSLSNVIHALRNRGAVPSFRNSKLTRILQPVLTEGSYTAVVCTVNPSKDTLHESLNTLRFGNCAGAIRLQVYPKSTDRTPVKMHLAEEVASLASELEISRRQLEICQAELETKNAMIDQERRTLELTIMRLDLLERSNVDLQEENIQLSKDLSRLQILAENLTHEITVRCEAEKVKALAEQRRRHDLVVESFKAEMVELLETKAGSSIDAKLHRRLIEYKQRQEDLEKELVISRSWMTNLREDNRNLRRELEEIRGEQAFRARKIPVPCFSLTSALKSQAKAREAIEQSPRSYLYSPRSPARKLMKEAGQIHAIDEERKLIGQLAGLDKSISKGVRLADLLFAPIRPGTN